MSVFPQNHLHRFDVAISMAMFLSNDGQVIGTAESTLYHAAYRATSHASFKLQRTCSDLVLEHLFSMTDEQEVQRLL